MTTAVNWNAWLASDGAAMIRFYATGDGDMVNQVYASTWAKVQQEDRDGT